MLFNTKYLAIFCILLITEIGIALFVNDQIIRPFVGDLLVVLLLYSFVRAFTSINTLKATIGVLLFAYVVELIQATPFIDWIGLSDHKIAKIILGNTFDWKDLFAYTLGALLILIFEKYYIENDKQSP